jgi:hypothetical protein
MNENTDVYKKRLLNALRFYKEERSAVDMGDLYRMVFQREFIQKINDTRPLRDLVTELRQDGYPIGSTAKRNGGGYYIITRPEQLEDYAERSQKRAIKILSMVAKIKRVSMRELLGQLSLNL